MRAGRLDRKITIQRKTVTQSTSGDPQETWATIGALRRSAGIWTPAAGDESFSNPQLVARQKVEWLIRYSDDTADLSPMDRIIYPALNAAGDTLAEKDIYDVTAVTEHGRREGLRIVTARRPDIQP